MNQFAFFFLQNAFSFADIDQRLNVVADVFLVVVFAVLRPCSLRRVRSKSL